MLGWPTHETTKFSQEDRNSKDIVLVAVLFEARWVKFWSMTRVGEFVWHFALCKITKEFQDSIFYWLIALYSSVPHSMRKTSTRKLVSGYLIDSLAIGSRIKSRLCYEVVVRARVFWRAESNFVTWGRLYSSRRRGLVRIPRTYERGRKKRGTEHPFHFTFLSLQSPCLQDP